tara:strand:- start:1075 stop:1326 length:252 start_codon:yes stop_codon:yes gene_type:complete
MYTVITRDQCNFCDTAKELLKKSGQGYIEYNVQSESSRWVLTLLKKADIKTVPQIFASSGRYIGGYSELKEMIGRIEGPLSNG